MTISWSLQAPSSWRSPTQLLAEYSVSCLEWLLQWVYINITCINIRFVCQNYNYEIIRLIISLISLTISRLGCRICSLLTWIQRETSLCSASQFSSPWWAFSSLRPLIFLCATSDLYYTKSKGLIFRCCPSGWRKTQDSSSPQFPRLIRYWRYPSKLSAMILRDSA